jgi:hypothetical protein
MEFLLVQRIACVDQSDSGTLFFSNVSIPLSHCSEHESGIHVVSRSQTLGCDRSCKEESGDARLAVGDERAAASLPTRIPSSPVLEQTNHSIPVDCMLPV